MSYNIDTWKTKRLKDFRVPLEAFFSSSRKDWHPTRLNEDDGSVTLDFGWDSEMHGSLVDGILHVDRIVIRGEGSGFLMHEIIEPAFRKSTGVLEAARVWEGGDSIDRLRVCEGVVTAEDIEL